MTVTVSTRSNLVHLGYTEDGQAVLGEPFQAVLEDSEGRRWASRRSFCSHEACEPDPDDYAFGPYFVEDYDIETKVDRYEARIQKLVDGGKDLTRDPRFCEIQPCYGSQAYQDGGWEEANARREYEEEMYG